MKTLINIILGLSLFSLLSAQVDTLATESSMSDSLETADEMVEPLETQAEAMFVSDSSDIDSTLAEVTVMDSALADSNLFMVEDTVVTPEPAMEWVQNALEPVTLTGLINEAPLYYWSNEVLETLHFETLPYISIVDPAMIAIKANDCLDIVCHLLATDSSDVDYVVVTKDDGSHVQIYNTVTKVVAIEAPSDSIALALDAYLAEQAGMQYLAVATEDSTLQESSLSDGMGDLTVDAARMEVLKIKRLHFRALEDIARNPANLARHFERSINLNLFPDFKFNVRNSLLTPGWYKKWWTVGGVWDEAMKSDFLSTIEGQNMTINISPNFQTLFGFRTGNFAFNLSGLTHVKMTIPGNLIGLPFQDILLNDPIDLSGLEIESIPLMGKAAFSYARPVNTPYGEVKIGLGLNTYKGFGYVKVINHELTQITTEDSVITITSGEGWATEGGIDGHLDNLNTDDFDAMSTASDFTFGLDFGAIMDLQPLVHQEVEVQLSLKNIGANYKWSGLTHETWTFVSAIPAPGSAETDSVEQYQSDSTTVLGTDETLKIKIPTVFNLAAYYQPIAKVIIGVGIEKAFTDDVRFGYSPDLELYYQLNFYAADWVDLSYYHQTRYGDPVHTFGTGFHFGFLETGLSLSFFNGINSDAKGIGFGINSSLHF